MLIVLLGVAACNDNTDQLADPASNRTFAITEFPNAAGMSWTYSVYDSLAGQTDTATVSVGRDTELVDHTSARMWITTRGLLQETTYVAVHGNTIGFYETRSSGDPEVLIFPLEIGASWGTGVDSNSVVGIDAIDTPQGPSNESFHVWRRVAGLNYGRDTHTWLVPRIGIVKRTRNQHDFTPPVKETWLLISKVE